jgi:hypothetical protein
LAKIASRWGKRRIGIAAGEVDGLPILFETLVLPSGEIGHHATYEQALEGHDQIVKNLAL